MRKLLLLSLGVAIGAATWFLLFVIIGVSLGTSFIAGGVALGALAVVAGLSAVPGVDRLVRAPLTVAGLTFGVATFVILAVVLSVPLWVDVISGLGVMGLADAIGAAIGPPATPDPIADEDVRRRVTAPATPRYAGNGHDVREPVGAR